MANTIRYIDDDAGDHVFPVTHERGVFDDNGQTIEPKLQHAQDLSDALVTTTTYTTADLLTMRTYDYTINGSTGKWGTSSSSKHLRIFINPGDTVYLTSNSTNAAGIAFFKSHASATSGGTPAYAGDATNRTSIPAGKSIRLAPPADAVTMYIYLGTSGSDAYLPDSVVIRSVATERNDSPLPTFKMRGLGNTMAYSSTDLTQFLPGRRYRFYLTGWEIDEVTSSSANYLIYFAYYDSGGTSHYLIEQYMGSARKDYYDILIPSDSVRLNLGLRANSGTTVTIISEDITSLSVPNAVKGDIIAANAIGFPEKSGLSAKDIKGEITYTLAELEASFTRATDGQVLAANSGSSNVYGMSLSLATRSSGPDASSYHNFRIPMTDVVAVEFRQYGTAYNYGSVFVDSEDKIVGVMGTQGVLNQTTTGNISVGVPENATYFIYSCNITLSTAFATLKYRKSDADIANSIDELENEVGGKDISYAGYRDIIARNSGAYVYRLQEMYNLESISVGSNLSDITFRSSGEQAKWPSVMIPVEGFDTLSCYWRSREASSHRGSVFLDENNDVTGKIQYSTGQRAERQIPSGTKYLLYNVAAYNDSDSVIVLKKAASISSRLSALESEVGAGSSSNSLSTGMTPGLSIGKISNAGIVDGDTKYMTTEPIFGNFRLGVGDGYVIYAGSLFDRQGNMVSFNHSMQTSDVSASQLTWSWRKTFSTLNMPSDYGYRLVIAKQDGTDFTSNDKPISLFVAMKDAPVKRWIPEDLPNYEIAQQRINYMQKALWTPLVKVHNSSTKNSDVDIAFCLADSLMTSLPYSDLGLTRKFVPACVSMRTFLTATKNKRSLLYTEDLFDNVSKYGLDYSNAYRCGSYYGCACNAFTGWVMGLNTLYQSGHYNSNTVPGLSTVSSANANNVRPLDLIWNDGHISIISDIFKDEYGNVKYVVWAEMTTPYCKRTIYTAEQFEARLSDRSCAVHRWNKWNTITAPMEIPGYNPHELGGTHQYIPYCEDIMCFAGDYAAFASGDIIYLNARRAETYTDVLLYKDDVLLETIDISELSVDGSDGEDWVKVNLTTLNLGAGKYKACLTDGTNTTGFTFFEVVGVTFSAELSGSSLVATFSATGGTPVSFEGCSNAGFIASAHPITASEVEAGTLTVSNWTASGNPYLYLAVVGDYGTVYKRISYPSAS